jgi:hypothetical protein
MLATVIPAWDKFFLFKCSSVETYLRYREPENTEKKQVTKGMHIKLNFQTLMSDVFVCKCIGNLWNDKGKLF